MYKEGFNVWQEEQKMHEKNKKKKDTRVSQKVEIMESIQGKTS